MKPLKVKILNKVRAKGALHRVDCIDSDGRLIELNWFASDLDATLDKDMFYVITNYSEETKYVHRILGRAGKRKDGGARPAKLSAVFRVETPFKIQADALAAFNHAPTVTIPEALNSEVGRRISLEAQVQQLYPKDGNKQTMRLLDPSTNGSILVKFWEMTEIDPKQFPKSLAVKIRNVSVGSYQDKADVNSTPETVVDVVHEPVPAAALKELQIEIIARNAAEVVSMAGDVYYITDDSDDVKEGV